MPPSRKGGASQHAERYPPPPPVRRAENHELKVDRARAGPAAHHGGRRLNPVQNAPGQGHLVHAVARNRDTPGGE